MPPMWITSPTISRAFWRRSRRSTNRRRCVAAIDIGRAVRDTAALNPGNIFMSHEQLAKTIDDAFEARADISPATKGPVRDAVEQALDLLDRGAVRVAERRGNGLWQVNQWLKKAVLLSFRLTEMSVVPFGMIGPRTWGWDKVPLKYDRWERAQFEKAQFRAVPGAIVRRSAYIAPNVVLMP